MKKLVIKNLEAKARQIRIEIIKMLASAGTGHSAGSLGMADVFAALYFNILKHDPRKPDWSLRDRLVLSNGHICPVLYATLALSGYFPVSELKTLRKFGSRLQGHPSRLSLPGIETSTGPLGQGISVAVGMAFSHRTFCLMSDGELQEGACWEAFLLANKYDLNNLIVIVDRNGIQIDGQTEEILPLEPLADKFKAFGFKVFQINGHSFEMILGAVQEAAKSKRPIAILAYTVPGKGVSFMEGDPAWHGRVPDDAEAVQAIKELSK